jgi:hypothetical protein
MSLGRSQKTVVSPVAKGVGVTLEVRLQVLDLDLLHLTSSTVLCDEPKYMRGPNLFVEGVGVTVEVRLHLSTLIFFT